VQHEAAAGLDRAAVPDADMLAGRAGRNAQLLQQIRKRQRTDQAVDHQAHGAVRGMGAHVDHGSGETRVSHGGHRHQQLAGDETLMYQTLAHGSHLGLV
jgi:hypothetical protein